MAVDDGGSGPSGGGAATSLNTSRFRTIEVATSPGGSGTVSDNFGDFGSAVQDCERCRERYQLEVTVALAATPDPVFRFVEW